MYRKKAQLVSLLEVIREMKKDITELQINQAVSANGKKLELPIDINKKISDADMVSGSFLFEGRKFTFFDRASKSFGVHQITMPVEYDSINSISEEMKDAIENFNVFRVGLKATYRLNKMNRLLVLFSVEVISSGHKSVIDQDSVKMYLKVLTTGSFSTVKAIEQMKS